MRFTALWILWIGLTLASHSGMGSGEAVPAAPGTPQRERLLQAREGAWRAWFTNDQERMKAVFPPDTIAINAGQETWDGQKETLAGAQKFAAGRGKLVSLEFPRTEIQVYGEVAVLYSLYRVETETGGHREVQQGRHRGLCLAQWRVDQPRLAHRFRKMRKTSRVLLRFHPATPGRWRDLEQLLGERGACGGCWCMSWRVRRSQFEKQKGAGNKRALRRLVRSGRTPGVLAYAGGSPVGWCSVAPRPEFSFLERSRVLAPVDDRPVWSVTCLFVARPSRRRGLSVKLLKAAVALVRRQGGRIVEGYPVEVARDALPDVFAWTGLAAAYRRAGFREAARRSATRPIMRYYIGGRRGR